MARQQTPRGRVLSVLTATLLIFSLFSLLHLGCDCGDDDDDAADDDSGGVLDDDSSDDDASDDDAAVDDDAGDDDAADDDAVDDDTAVDDDAVDDDIPDAQLMLIGLDTSSQYASWRQTDSGWVKELLPPSPYDENASGLGPTFFLDGQYGFATYNEIEPGFDWSWSKSHTWLAYDVANGWRIDETRPSAGGNTNVYVISAPQVDQVFAYAAREVYLVGYPNGTLKHGLYRYAGEDLADEWALPRPDLEHLAWSYSLTMLSPTAGLACVTAKAVEHQAHLLEYNGVDWQERALPTEYGDGCLTSLALTDTRNGLVIWTGLYDSDETELLDMQDGAYVEVETPAACDYIDPTSVVAQGDNALAYDGASEMGETNYLVRFDGQWRCQQFAKAHYFQHGLVTRNGRVFLALKSVEDRDYFLYEILASGREAVTLPDDLGYLFRVHALGEGAPRFSSYNVGGI